MEENNTLDESLNVDYDRMLDRIFEILESNEVAIVVKSATYNENQIMDDLKLKTEKKIYLLEKTYQNKLPNVDTLVIFGSRQVFIFNYKPIDKQLLQELNTQRFNLVDQIYELVA